MDTICMVVIRYHPPIIIDDTATCSRPRHRNLSSEKSLAYPFRDSPQTLLWTRRPEKLHPPVLRAALFQPFHLHRHFLCMALAARSVLGRLPVCRNLHSLKRICCQPHAQPQIRLTDKRIANFSAGACFPPNAAFQRSICENSKRRTAFRVRYFNKNGQDFSLW